MKEWIGILLTIAIAALAIAIAKPGRASCPASPRIERACVLAKGNAMRHIAWLEPGHLRREAALLLLSEDAAWAPLCAKDERAGERLRNQITDEIGTPDAPRAAALARELVHLLSDRETP